MTNFLNYEFNSPEQKAYNEGYDKAIENTFDPVSKSTVKTIASEIAAVLDRASILKVSAQVLYCMLMFHADQMMGAIREDAADRIAFKDKGDKDHD